MIEKFCRFADVSFTLVSEHKMLEFLIKWLRPYVSFDQLAINESRYQIEIIQGPISSCNHSSKIISYDDKLADYFCLDGSIYVYIPSDHIQYKITDNKFEIIVDYMKKVDFNILMACLRAVRGFIVDIFSNCIKLHGAIIKYKDNAIALLGGKCSGKSTLCLNLVLGVKEIEFISNDKFLYSISDNKVYGLPAAISIESDNEHLQNLNAIGEPLFLSNGKNYYWPSDIFAFEKISPFATLKQCYALHFNDDFCISPLSLNQRREFIEKNVLLFSDKMGFNWLDNILNPNKNRNKPFNFEISNIAVPSFNKFIPDFLSILDGNQVGEKLCQLHN